MFHWQEQVILTHYQVGISQKQNRGSWDAFPAHVETLELSQAVWRYHRKETPQWPLQLYRTHGGQVPELFALQTLNFLSKGKAQEQGCNPAHTESAVPGESCSSPGQRGKSQSKRILRDGAQWLQPHRAKVGWQGKNFTELPSLK